MPVSSENLVLQLCTVAIYTLNKPQWLQYCCLCGKQCASEIFQRHGDQKYIFVSLHFIKSNQRESNCTLQDIVVKEWPLLSIILFHKLCQNDCMASLASPLRSLQEIGSLMQLMLCMKLVTSSLISSGLF